MYILGGVLMLRVLANQNRSDEWYTPENVVRQMLDLFPPPKGGTILCPFDTADSNFVKVLQENCDNKVVYGVRDFMTRDYQFDYLITNPPFSYKDRIIERCINTGKPCVLLLPLDTLGGHKRHKLYTGTNISVYVPSKRIKFINQDGYGEKSPAHHSIFMMLNSPVTDIRYEFQGGGTK